MRKDRANFNPEYTVWFNPELNIDGNGFAFVKIDENGCVTEKGVGDPDSFSTVTDYDFRYYNRDDYICDSIKELDEDWDKMKLGDSRDEIMSRFGTKYGTVYSQTQTETGESLPYMFMVHQIVIRMFPDTLLYHSPTVNLPVAICIGRSITVKSLN